MQQFSGFQTALLRIGAPPLRAADDVLGVLHGAPVSASDSSDRPASRRDRPRRASRPDGLIQATRLASDLAAFALAVALSRLIAPGGWTLLHQHGVRPLLATDNRGLVTAVLLAGVLTSFRLLGHYMGRVEFWREVSQVMSTVLIALTVLGVFSLSFTGTALRLWMMVQWLAFIPAALGARALSTWLLARCGAWCVRTVVIGDAQRLDDVSHALQSDRRLGYCVVDQISAQDFVASAASLGVPGAMLALRADLAVVALGAANIDAERALVQALDRAQVAYAVVPSAYTLPAHGVASQYFFGHDVVLLHPGDAIARPYARLAKVTFDLLVAGALVVFLAPLLLLLAVLIRRDGGPALFSHARIGINGAVFGCLKFRTMVTDSEWRLAELLSRDTAAASEWAATQKLRDDPRITPIGRFLRRTSLDELPQLFNVLRGEMSLVGPRPVVQAEMARYAEDAAYYCKARPGLTGLWQVSGRSGTTYERRVRLDVWYVRNWSLWHDVAILLKTIPAVLSRRGSA